MMVKLCNESEVCLCSELLGGGDLFFKSAWQILYDEENTFNIRPQGHKKNFTPLYL